MSRVTINAHGSATHHPDGAWTFPERKAASVLIDKGDVVGFCYEVSGESDTVTVELSIVFHAIGDPAPRPQYTTSTVVPDDEYTRHAPPPPALFEAGRPMLATFCARTTPDEEPVTVSMMILPMTAGLIFSKHALFPATDADIAAFETRFRTRRQPDYRAFLKTVNGADLVWYRDSRWIKGPIQYDADGRYQPSGFYEDLSELEPEIRSRLGAGWESVTFIFGIGNGHPFIDIASGESDEFGFYRKELMAHAYLVAVDVGGNNYVQVAEGRHAGRVFGVDHELYYGGLSPFVDFDGLSEAEIADLPWTDFAQATTDAVIDEAEKFSFLYPVAESFTQFYETECSVAKALSEALAPKYLRQ